MSNSSYLYLSVYLACSDIRSISTIPMETLQLPKLQRHLKVQKCIREFAGDLWLITVPQEVFFLTVSQTLQ